MDYIESFKEYIATSDPLRYALDIRRLETMQNLFQITLNRPHTLMNLAIHFNATDIAQQLVRETANNLYISYRKL